MENKKVKSHCLAHKFGIIVTFLGFLGYIAAEYLLREKSWLANWIISKMDFSTFLFSDLIPLPVKLVYISKWYGIYVGVIGLILWIIGYSIDSMNKPK